MTEEANKEDVTSQEAVIPAEATESVNQPTPPAEGSKEYNFRAMEERNNRLAQEVGLLKQQISERQQKATEEPPKEEFSLADDDLVTYGQLSKLADARAKKVLEEELNKRERNQMPANAKAKYSDYEQVMSTENINELIKEDADLEHDIQVSRNPFERTYKAIKNSNFYRERVKNQSNQKKIDENLSIPKSANDIGKQSPLTTGTSYANADRKTLWAEMMKYKSSSI